MCSLAAFSTALAPSGWFECSRSREEVLISSVAWCIGGSPRVVSRCVNCGLLTPPIEADNDARGDKDDYEEEEELNASSP